MEVDEIIGKDETVSDVVRRHPIAAIPMISAGVLIGATALAGIYFIARSGGFDGSGSLLVGLAAVFALGFILAYVSWWVYRQNRLILTDKNLYEITQDSLFSKKISQFGLERLQDASAAQNGIIANILDYGNVTIQTAGKEENFIFETAPNPQRLAAKIIESHKQYAHTREGREDAAI